MPLKTVRAETVARVECQIFRDFCSVATTLLEQFRRFERSQTISYPALRDLLGEPVNRGPLWRLKDSSHLLFSGNSTSAANLLDLTFGSIFHETVKLMEGTYQSQHYSLASKELVSKIRIMGTFNMPDKLKSKKQREEEDLLLHLGEKILSTLKDSSEDLKHGKERLATLIELVKPLLCICFEGKKDNQMLLKFLETRKEIVKKVFEPHFDVFIKSLHSNANKNI